MKFNFLHIVSMLFALNILPTYATKKQDLSILLLTDHYGILTYSDLELYTINRNIRPFDRGLEYWQCFDSKNININYSDWVNDDITGEQYCEMHIVVTLNDEKAHEYGLRRAQPLEYCKEKKALWNKIMKNQSHTCLGGIYVGDTKERINGTEVYVKGWVYDRIKTKKDYDTYF